MFNGALLTLRRIMSYLFSSDIMTIQIKFPLYFCDIVFVLISELEHEGARKLFTQPSTNEFYATLLITYNSLYKMNLR